MARTLVAAGGRRAASARSSSVSSRLLFVRIIGGFLNGVTLDLSEYLNCLIGARGTGKSTLMWFVRYALDAFPEGEEGAAMYREVESLLEHNLGGGRIEVGIQTSQGLSYLVSRCVGEEPTVLTADGKPTNLSVTVGGLFNIHIFTQNEIESIADRAVSQLVLLDRFQSAAIAEIERKIRGIVSRLLANASEIQPLQQQLSLLDEEIGTLPGVEEKLKGFVDVGGENAQAINRAHLHKAQRDRERRSIETMHQFLGDYQERIDGLCGQVGGQVSALFPRDLLLGRNSGALTPIKDALMDAAARVDDLLRQAKNLVEETNIQLTDQASALATLHTEQEMEFRVLIEKYQEAQGQTVERTRLERLRNELLAKQHQRQELSMRLGRLLDERTSLMAQLSDLRNQRYAIRESVARHIGATLTPFIRVSVVESGNPQTYRSLLEEMLRGARLKHNVVAQKLANAFWPAQLVAAVRAEDAKSLIHGAGLNAEQAQRVIEVLAGSGGLFDLEIVELIDLPRIELKDGEEYKDSRSLSTGQKCTTILPILLMDSDGPLLVDQPEDNLDNRFIFQYVVESILRIKRKRQLLFVTHNPNIPVLADAERVFVLESDGSQATKANEGTVEECKQQIVTLLEGGEEAFKRRIHRYAY